MPFISKSTGIPTVDKVFKEVFAILNRFQGGEVASSSGEPVYWADIINKPTTFTPSAHSHLWADITDKPSTFTPSEHDHDDRYYTETETNNLLNNKENILGSPSTNGYILSSTTAGVRSWIAPYSHPTQLAISPTLSGANVLASLSVNSFGHVTAATTRTLTPANIGAQPSNSNLTAIAGLTPTDGNFIVGNGSTFVGRKLQNSDLPAIAITDTFVVSSQAAMLALSAAERGDVAVRTDLNKSFILKGDDYSKLEDWQELLSPTDAVLSVDGRTGVVSLSDKYQPLDTDLTTIAGLTHSNRHVMVSNGSSWTRRALEEADLPSLSISKITNLQTALDNKQATISTGVTGQFYAWDKTMKAVDWSYVANKPSSFTPSAHTHPWSGITDKPSTFTPSTHNHNRLIGIVDTRNVATTPNDYPKSVIPQFKDNAAIGLGAIGTYSTTLGIYGWNDSSGGHAHELAFSTLGIYNRSGSPGSSWGNWKRLLTTEDISTTVAPAITGTANKVLSIQADGTGVKTGVLSDDGTNAIVTGNIIADKSYMRIHPTSNNSLITIGGGVGGSGIANGAFIMVSGNDYTGYNGDLRLYAGVGTTERVGAVYVSPRMYFNTRPANDHRWTLALDQYNTLYAIGSGMNIMHNLYFDGTDWRYRYGAGSASGGVLVTAAYNQFSVSTAQNGTADSVAALNPAIYTNLSGNTAFGKNTFVGGYKVEVEGNALVNGTLKVNTIVAKSTAASVFLTHDNNTIKTRTAAQVLDDIGAAAVSHTHPWSGITGKPTGTTNYITMFTNGATGAIGNSQLSQSANEVTASKGFTSIDYLLSEGPLYTKNNIYLINKAGNAWLNFVTRDVSGSEAVADLLNVGSITPAGTALKVNGDVFLRNNLQLINRNGDPWTVIERNTTGSGNTAHLKSIVKLNDMDVANDGFSRNGDIGISGNRVVMSRRNVGNWTTISRPGGVHLINLNDYPGVTRFELVATSGDVIIGFYNGVIGDEIFVKCYNYNNPRILSGGDGTNWSVHDGQFFHFTCEGSATQKWGSNQYSANLWMKW